MQVRQAFATRQQPDREDWMQYLDRLRGCEARAFLTNPLPPSVMKSCSASSNAFVILSCEENSPLSMHPTLPSLNLHCGIIAIHDSTIAAH